MELIGEVEQSGTSLHHGFIIASSSLQPFTFKGSSGSPKRGGCGLAPLSCTAVPEFIAGPLGHRATGRSLDDLQGKTLQQRETFLAQVLSSKRDFHASLVASLVPLFSEATWICLKYPVPQIHWLIIFFPVKHCHFADIFGYTTFSVTPQGSHFFPLPGDQTKTKTICDANICLKLIIANQVMGAKAQDGLPGPWEDCAMGLFPRKRYLCLDSVARGSS